MLLLVMVPIREINPEEIRGVLYLDTVTKGKMDGVKFFMMDGTSHTYHGDDLPLALALAKEKFPAEPGSTRMSDQPLKY
jgi:hypothetical protein